MVTEDFDNLVLKCGGLSGAARKMTEKGYSITHTSIRRWYSSDKVYPRGASVAVCEIIAKELGIDFSKITEE